MAEPTQAVIATCGAQLFSDARLRGDAPVGDGAHVVAAIHAYLARQEQEQSAVRAVETAQQKGATR